MAEPAPQRAVSLLLTPWAPGVLDLPLAEQPPAYTIWGRPLTHVLAGTLRRLQRAPAEITPVWTNDDDEDAAHEIELQAAVEDSPVPVALAVIFAGAAVEDVAQALGQLVRSGWRPPVTQPSSPFDKHRTQGVAA